jgi:hypothetical protein
MERKDYKYMRKTPPDNSGFSRQFDERANGQMKPSNAPLNGKRSASDF